MLVAQMVALSLTLYGLYMFYISNLVALAWPVIRTRVLRMKPLPVDMFVSTVTEVMQKVRGSNPQLVVRDKFIFALTFCCISVTIFQFYNKHAFQFLSLSEKDLRTCARWTH